MKTYQHLRTITPSLLIALTATLSAQPTLAQQTPTKANNTTQAQNNKPKQAHDTKQNDPAPKQRTRQRTKRHKTHKIPVERVDEAIQTLHALHPTSQPRWLTEITQLAKTDPAKAAKKLRRFPRIREIMETRKRRPQVFKVHIQATQLTHKTIALVKAYQQQPAQQTPEQKQAHANLKKQIRANLEQIFDLRIKLKQMEIEWLKQKLAHAKKQVKTLQNKREDHINRRLNAILQHKPHKTKPGKKATHPKQQHGNNKADKPQQPAPTAR